jgi:hypothetical protein
LLVFAWVFLARKGREPGVGRAPATERGGGDGKRERGDVKSAGPGGTLGPFFARALLPRARGAGRRVADARGHRAESRGWGVARRESGGAFGVGRASPSFFSLLLSPPRSLSLSLSRALWVSMPVLLTLPSTRCGSARCSSWLRAAAAGGAGDFIGRKGGRADESSLLSSPPFAVGASDSA